MAAALVAPGDCIESSEFAESLRPLLFWIRLIGIDLPTCEVRSPFRHWVHFLFGSLMFVANVGLSVHAVNLFECGLTRKTQRPAFQWNVFTHHVIYAVRNVGIHLTLFSFIRSEWKRLFTSFHSLQMRINLTPNCYHHIRWICTLGVFYAILKGFFLMILLVDGYVTASFIHAWNMSVDALNLAMEMYPNSALAVFCILGWSISTSLQSIRAEIDLAAAGRMTDEAVAVHLDKWKRIHVASCEATDLLNHCFGIVLLIETTFIFMDVIAGTFFLLFAFFEDNIVASAWMPFSLSLIGLNLFHLFAMAYVADTISAEGSSLITALRSLQLTVSSQSLQLSQFMSEIHYSVPRIRAMGFFTVGRQLIPALLGTTLTYLVILFQFYRTEKN